jgi:glycosyltransferase involved in cell wall biosynthesis
VQIQIWDPVAPHSYSKGSLNERPMGGTEATVIRVANGLDDLGHRTKITFSLEDWGDRLIILRDPNALAHVDRPAVLWMHDYLVAGDISPRHLDLINKKKPKVVAVSDWHKSNVEEHLGIEATRIYNPCGPVPVRSKVPNKFVYLGSPHKGLERTLEVFAEYRKLNPKATLYILNPGYCPSPNINTKWVKTLGPLKHLEAMRHLAEAQALLHFNDKCPETFGIVYAEAKAAGTTVCTYMHNGAAEEVLEWSGRFFDIHDSLNDPAHISYGIGNDEPHPHPDPRFDPDQIAQEWETLLLYNGQ